MRIIVSRHPATVAFLRQTLGWREYEVCRVCGDRRSEVEWERRWNLGVGDQGVPGGQGGCGDMHEWLPPVAAVASATEDDVRGAVVAGNVPLHLAALAAEVIAVEFSGDPPRGAEYGAVEMEAAGVRLTRYQVRALAHV